MSGSLPCFSHISASRDVGQLKTTLSAFLHRSINTLMPSNLMTLNLKSLRHTRNGSSTGVPRSGYGQTVVCLRCGSLPDGADLLADAARTQGSLRCHPACRSG